MIATGDDERTGRNGTIQRPRARRAVDAGRSRAPLHRSLLPWQDFDVGGLADELGVDATFSGWRGIGFIVGILTIIVLCVADRPARLGGHPAARLDRDDRRSDRTLVLIFTSSRCSRSSGTSDDLGVGERRSSAVVMPSGVHDGAGGRWRRHAEERGELPRRLGRHAASAPPEAYQAPPRRDAPPRPRRRPRTSRARPRTTRRRRTPDDRQT